MPEEPQHPDPESTFVLLIDNRPDGKRMPFLRETYYLGGAGGVARERDFGALTGEPYQVLGVVTDHDPTGTVADRLRQFAMFCQVAAESPRPRRRWWERTPHPRQVLDMTRAAAEDLGLR